MQLGLSEAQAMDGEFPVTISEWRAAQVAGNGLARLQSLVAHQRAHNEQSRVWISLATDKQIAHQWHALSSDNLPLYGVPFAVKDNIDAATFRSTAACPSFNPTAATEDATVVKRLKAAGAILIGKTNLDQFATGLVGTRSPYGAVPNSFDPSYVSGGSSSGSAVSVARAVVPFSLGTDTAGSGRVPAGLNNIYGLKPTRGALSTKGVVPACRSLDCVSIFALTVDDAETILHIAEGFDEEDAYSRARPSQLTASGLGENSCASPTKTPTFAVCNDPAWYGDDEQADAYASALKRCTGLGWKLVPVSFADLFALAKLLYEGPWVAERFAAIHEFIESGSEMDPTVRTIVLGAKNFSAVDTFLAEYKRQELTRQVQSTFKNFDGLLVPTTPLFPTMAALVKDPIGENSKLGTYTNFVNFLDWSAFSVPAGFRGDGLPFGVTLIANSWQETALLAWARQLVSGTSHRLGSTQHLAVANPGHEANAPLADSPRLDRIRVAVVGAHLRGFPLNKDLVSRGAVFEQLTSTSSTYRLFALSNSEPRKPGLRQALTGEVGEKVEVEVWSLPRENFAGFMETIPFPLGIGTIQLADGTWVKGFVCEYSALQSALDITHFGGWRAYNRSIQDSSPHILPPKATARRIKSVLIANRGEIALRILKTLRQMGIKAVTIYSDADAACPHVRDADVALRLEGTSVIDTYLNADKILQLAKSEKVDAIIPGYGFLSENADFARRVEEHGIVWVGPTPDQMSDLGLKHRARAIAQQAGVPTVPGSPELIAELEKALSEAHRVGFPLMLKSTAGGGGIGLRQCNDVEELREAFDGVKRLASANFADDGVFLERFIRNARHVEVQILGDGTGRVLAAGERDCSLQRRHQKVVEESPASMIPAAIRSQIRQSAIKLASSVKYRNVGTVEFIYDVDSQEFFFLEVNTRLQVEHPVTESVTGLDLVQCMINIAAQDFAALFHQKHNEVESSGASIEVRVYAEDPVQSFQPCHGLITNVKFPEWLRVDTWIEKGTEVSTSYDPMLAKLITFGKDRQEALEIMARGLAETRIDGVQSNLKYLRQIISSEMFRTGSYTTTILDTFQFVTDSLTILQPGGSLAIQDFPGRVGFWDIGVPPSGPMDDLSFRLANRLVSNDDHAAAFECTLRGPSLKFHCDTVIAVTGGQCEVFIDDLPVKMYQALCVSAGQHIHCKEIETGYRIYIAVAGGIDVPLVMGSRSTFDLAQLGGHKGRKLAAADVIHLNTNGHKSESRTLQSAVPLPIPSQPNAKWTIGVIPGPHGAPDIFNQEGIDALFDNEWDVHYNSNRLGIRLQGVRPSWARQNGGSAGLHPSNIHDAPYSIGSVSFTGDEAIVLTVDGPSLGGFAVFCVVAAAELWKLGQVRPGDKIKLQPINLKRAHELEMSLLQSLNSFEFSDPFSNPSEHGQQAAEFYSTMIGEVDDNGTKIVAKQAGDRGILLEFGQENDGFDIWQSARSLTLIQQHRVDPIPDVRELTPGVRTLHVTYTSQADPGLIFQRLVKSLTSREVPLKVPSRIVSLPLAFDDSVTRAALDRYSATIRSQAPWLPSNIKFLEQLNGIDDLQDVLQQSTFLVLGLGDVYLGSPCAIPLDPRQRLFGTKYNPSRSFTPRGSVGIGGQYMCIYAMNSPGGYQLVGRTTDIWSSTPVHEGNRGAGTDTNNAWIFQIFDRITFHPVTESDIDTKSSSELIKISDGTLDLVAYKSWLEENKSEIAEWEAKRAEHRDNSPFMEELIKPYDSGLTRSLDNGSMEIVGDSVRAPMPGRCWRIAVVEGQKVKKGEALVYLECSKMEIEVSSPIEGVCARVSVQEGRIVQAQDELLVIQPLS
ncbi:hypothetical protein PFICI_00808 [Pestalotiopsis fici W106-1]|uniref:Urea amidolyase n=1 Tax=Pestalotiopsis fici (strain W106-1 / CGMCC3.15140) TaxID=1229662 RepID=W3XLY0_PESFW|nr:uncharacterized protein PFICI_00808 [Pestalotiopsis fici W106-1]ETS86980.1 hypothetical protein PFICI_00808 [Pestalotiopsis fici W106-1]